MLGLLLARAGVSVVVLEKHGDFLRDFRGDTIHPSTLEILDQIGLADSFLELPHTELSTLNGSNTAGQSFTFSLKRLRTKYRFIAFVPQWDFLSFITAEARKYRCFTLRMNSEVTDLITEDGIVRGVRYRTGTVVSEMRAPLTIGTDGRTSRTREAAELPIVATSPPMDVLWFRLSRKAEEVQALAGRLGAGQAAVLIGRREYWQIAYLIPKGEGDRVRERGLEEFRARVVDLLPQMHDRVVELREWDQIKLLSVRSDRLTRWHRRGYLAIGDAAHAMSPVGGVGINIAIHDAVAAANILWEPLRSGRVTENDLARVQDERETPVRLVQAAQSLIQTRLFRRALRATSPPKFPPFLSLLMKTPVLRDIPPRLVAFGVGRPRVQSPRLAPARRAVAPLDTEARR